jgi:hypothetical protein
LNLISALISIIPDALITIRMISMKNPCWPGNTRQLPVVVEAAAGSEGQADKTDGDQQQCSDNVRIAICLSFVTVRESARD